MIASRLATLALLMPLAFTAGFARAAEPWHVVGSLALPGPVRWDYIASDPATGRLFVTREHSVDLVEAGGGRVLASIPDLGRAHGVALDAARGRGYVSDGEADVVVAFDSATGRVAGRIPVGRGPDAIAFDAATATVFAVNHTSRDVTPVDVASGRAEPAIALPDEPEFAVSDDAGRLFVNLTNKAQVAVIDTRARKVVATWPLGPTCADATGLALDLVRARLFATCRNGVLAVLRADDGRLVASVKIGKFSDAVAVDPSTGTAFSSNQDGTLSVVAADSTGTYAVRQTVTTRPGARTLALDARTHRLYLPSAVVDHVEPPTATRAYPLMVMRPGSFAILVVER